MYDLIIIGGGPAGITAAIYAARYKLNFLLLTESLGGWLNEIHQIENYPGFKSISGFELIEKYKEQLEYLNAPIIYENAVSLELFFVKKEKPLQETPTFPNGKNIFSVITHSNKIYQAKTIIIASGSKKQVLNIPGEKEFLGRGVSYCAVCDAMFFRGKKVAVIGGANSAVSAALHLADIAREVYLIYRKDKLKADESLVQNLESRENIKTIFNTNLTEIKGAQSVGSIDLDNHYENRSELILDGVFIEIGLVPLTAMIEKIGIELDEIKQIKVDQYHKTNVEGAFAAGDVTNGQGGLKQLVTAAGTGAIAATSANKYLKTNFR